MWSLLLAALLAACSFHPGSLGADGAIDGDDDAMVDAVVDATPWLAGYSHRKAIRVLPGGAAAALADIPIGIRIATDADLMAYAQPDGADLAITAADGTTLRTSELVSYSSATGATEIWTLLPALTLDAETTLYLYFGGTGLPAPVVGAVWTNGFKGVWHLTSSGDTELDSTSHANHLTQATLTQQPLAGKGVAGLGAGREFDGTDDNLRVLDPIDGSLDVGAASFSISIWLSSLGAGGIYDQSLYKGGTNGGNPGYTLFNGTYWASKFMENTVNYYFVDAGFGSPITGRWVHLVLVVDRDTATQRWSTYIDGALLLSGTFNLGTLDGTAPLVIGGVTYFFHGSIDEIRIYNRALPAEWIRTEFDNLMKSDFITVGPLQST